MWAVIFFILKDVLKYTFATAIVLTYVDIGPGGESLGSMVDTFRGLLTVVDWESLGTSIGEDFDNFMHALINPEALAVQDGPQ